jgi:hypothetical protein
LISTSTGYFLRRISIFLRSITRLVVIKFIYSEFLNGAHEIFFYSPSSIPATKNCSPIIRFFIDNFLIPSPIPKSVVYNPALIFGVHRAAKPEIYPAQ